MIINKTVKWFLLVMILGLLTACGESTKTTDKQTVDTHSNTGTITHNGTTYGFVTSPYTGRVWLDRNLGAAQICTPPSGNEACYGDYYQWGRNFDGHQDSRSNTTRTRATDVNNAGRDFITIYGLTDSYQGDWAGNADKNNSIRFSNWSKIDGSSICPVGYRVPTIDELKAELLDPGSAEAKDRDDAFNNFLKLPNSTGLRSRESGGFPFNSTHLWSITFERKVARTINLPYRDLPNSTKTPYAHFAEGLPVRCVRD